MTTLQIELKPFRTITLTTTDMLENSSTITQLHQERIKEDELLKYQP